MLSDNEIHEILAQALKKTETNDATRHEFDLSLQILGENGIFDSLDAMLFLDSVDELITARVGKDIGLMGDEAFSRGDSPFKSMGSLAEYVKSLLDEQ